MFVNYTQAASALLRERGSVVTFANEPFGKNKLFG